MKQNEATVKKSQKNPTIVTCTLKCWLRRECTTKVHIPAKIYDGMLYLANYVLIVLSTEHFINIKKNMYIDVQILIAQRKV